MKSILAPIALAGLGVLVLAGVAVAADPGAASNWAPPGDWTTPVATPAPVAPVATPAPATTPAPETTGMIAAMLGLTDAQVQELRMAGKSLADIAAQQKVDPQTLVDALAATWSIRIDARVTAGALTADRAAALKSNVAEQARAMVYQVAAVGMRGAAVGAGPNGTMRGQGAMRGQAGAGSSTGQGRGGGQMGAGRGTGQGRGGTSGAGAGTGTCPATITTPSS
jgi:hypothetical protein